MVGKAQPGYKNQYNEWSLDVAVDDGTRQALVKAGLGDKIKNKGDDRGDFITFKRRELKKDGTPAKPIEIVDRKGQPWGNERIGNGSVVNVQFAVNDGPDDSKRAGIIKLQVWEHVPYEGGDGDGERDEFPIANDDEEDWKN